MEVDNLLGSLAQLVGVFQISSKLGVPNKPSWVFCDLYNASRQASLTLQDTFQPRPLQTQTQKFLQPVTLARDSQQRTGQNSLIDCHGMVSSMPESVLDLYDESCDVNATGTNMLRQHFILRTILLCSASECCSALQIAGIACPAALESL